LAGFQVITYGRFWVFTEDLVILYGDAPASLFKSWVTSSELNLRSSNEWRRRSGDMTLKQSPSRLSDPVKP
jgi:hypothetical protein